jgi:hypothetical protein
MEAKGMHVSPQATSEYFTTLSALLEGVSSEFVWNIDEQDHAD